MRTADISYVARALESNFCHEVVSVAPAPPEAGKLANPVEQLELPSLFPTFGTGCSIWFLFLAMKKRDKEISVKTQNSAICN